MDKITQMNITKEDKNIIIEFPEIPKEVDRLDFMHRPTTMKFPETKSNKYLEFKAQSGEDTPQTPASMKGYTANHPEEVALEAFKSHKDYILSPQDIGAQILLDFGQYINNNTKLCAPIFNGKVGEKKEIKVWLNDGESLRSLDVLVKATKFWEENVKTETDVKIRNVLHPKFSEQNKVVDIVYSGLLMGAAKDFFKYSFSTLCGIPKIKVTGTKEDWNQIKDMVTGLGTVTELKEITPFYEWANNTVLDGIIGLYDGKEDINFWKSLIKHDSMSGAEGTSAGWLPSLNLYANKGEILPITNRWTGNNKTYQCTHLQVPVVSVELVSDNSVGIGNIDPTLDVKIGFTSKYVEGRWLKPCLGIDGYVKK